MQEETQRQGSPAGEAGRQVAAEDKGPSASKATLHELAKLTGSKVYIYYPDNKIVTHNWHEGNTCTVDSGENVISSQAAGNVAGFSLFGPYLNLSMPGKRIQASFTMRYDPERGLITGPVAAYIDMTLNSGTVKLTSLEVPAKEMYAGQNVFSLYSPEGVQDFRDLETRVQWKGIGKLTVYSVHLYWF